jgi:hypothetical protein
LVDNELFWRDELLQIMIWFRGEGFGKEVTAADMRRFLTDDAPNLEPYLDNMVEDGFLSMPAPGRYRLTALGRREGARRFQDVFAELTKPAHGECSPGCVCQIEGPEACAQRQHAHIH